MKYLFLVFSLLISISAFASVGPPMGDNSIMQCVGDEARRIPGLCLGSIFQYSDHKSNQINKFVSFKIARSTRKKLIKSLKKSIKKAKKAGEDTTELEKDLVDAKFLGQDIKTCFNFSYGCEGYGDGGVSNSNSCKVASNPLKSGSRDSFVDTFIINGSKCQGSDASPVVFIDGENSNCTGAYIGDGVVLTAAHCEGSFDNLVSNATGTKQANIVSYVIHPSYSTSSATQYDLALVFLDRNLPATETVKVNTNTIVAGEDVVFAGFGQNDENDSSELRAVFSTIDRNANGRIESDYEVGEEDGGVCFGDSGGGLLVFADNEWTVAGVASSFSAPPGVLCNQVGSSYSSNYAALSTSHAIQFIKDNTTGVLD